MQAIACDGKRESGERPACGDSGHEPQRGNDRDARWEAAVRRERMCVRRDGDFKNIQKTPARVQRGRGRGYLAAQFAAVAPSTAATAPAAAMISAASGEVA